MYLVASKYNSTNFTSPCYNIPTPFLFLLQLKVQVQFTLEPAMKARSDRRIYHYPFFKLWARLGGWGWGQSMSRPGYFTPGKETWYSLHMRLGKPDGQSGQVRKI